MPIPQHIIDRLPEKVQNCPHRMRRLEAATPLLAAAMVSDFFWKPREDGQLGAVRTITRKDLIQLQADIIQAKRSENP